MGVSAGEHPPPPSPGFSFSLGSEKSVQVRLGVVDNQLIPPSCVLFYKRPCFQTPARIAVPIAILIPRACRHFRLPGCCCAEGAEWKGDRCTCSRNLPSSHAHISGMASPNQPCAWVALGLLS